MAEEPADQQQVVSAEDGGADSLPAADEPVVSADQDGAEPPKLFTFDFGVAGGQLVVPGTHFCISSSDFTTNNKSKFYYVLSFAMEVCRCAVTQSNVCFISLALYIFLWLLPVNL